MRRAEDLRECKPLDASEFAVHLDQVRAGRAPADHQGPGRFFERTYLTKNLTSLASEVIRHLSGERTETNAIFNLATQFGGGKTHALTLLYHLARGGPAACRAVASKTARAATHAFGASRKRSRRSILGAPKKNGGLTACWRGRRDWAFN